MEEGRGDGGESGGGASSSGRTDDAKKTKMPTVVIVVGMAGSGKTSLVQRLGAHLRQVGLRAYLLNLDPAAAALPFAANIDIRDTVRYRAVMQEYGLGPNGAILTSLNLFATKFDEVVKLVEKRAPELDIVVVDTPGQIEIFTWSASGAIITEAFASTFPTVVCYVVDTPRCTNPTTFMSNILYACGILYKTRLPLLLAFNKTDVQRHEFALEWMSDFEAFQAAAEREPSFASSLSRSLALALGGLAEGLRSAAVSAVTGGGVGGLLEALEACREEYGATYKVELEEKRAEREKQQAEKRAAEMAKLREDLEQEKAKLGGSIRKKNVNQNVELDEEDEKEEDEEEEEDEDEDEYEEEYKYEYGK